MPFFSFSVNEINSSLKKFSITANKVYFSKNTKLWKLLNKKNTSYINILKQENRVPVRGIGKKILFCLPPSIGLGDAIEYASAIKTIIKEKIFDDLAVAFMGDYSSIFKHHFQIKDIYPYIIKKTELTKFDSVFHVTLEIKSLFNQKYNRSNIFNEIINYFKIKTVKNEKQKFYKINKVNKISIFPISSSPIRSMSIDSLNNLTKILKKDYEVEIFLDKSSEISNFLHDNIIMENISIVNPNDLSMLITMIKKIEYGLFMDSGPLHLAKMFHKRGLLLETSVSSNILLKDYNLIKGINNQFSSDYCVAPCGLTDIFNYKNNYGCYDSLKISKEKLKKDNYKNITNRGVKNNYLINVINPVSCVSSLNVQNIYNAIKKDIFL